MTTTTVEFSPAQDQRPAPVPEYLQEAYWWAYIHPRAVWFFEREWMIDAILLGNYRRLGDAALAAFDAPLRGNTLQMACVYGNLTPRLRARLAPDARLDVVDVLPIQLRNLARKLPPDPRVRLLLGNTAQLRCPDRSYDQVLLFFLLHEQPEHVRRATIAQALRVVKPGGRIVVVDYHEPAPWHPFKFFMRQVLRHLEPFALDLWSTPLEAYFSEASPARRVQRTLYFGRLYQRLIVQC